MDSRSRMVREGCLLSGYVMRWPDSKQTDGQIDMQRKHTRDAQLLVRQLKFIAKNCMLVVSCSCFVFANIFLRKWHCHPRYDELERSYIDHPMQAGLCLRLKHHLLCLPHRLVPVQKEGLSCKATACMSGCCHPSLSSRHSLKVSQVPFYGQTLHLPATCHVLLPLNTHWQF
jgi:hypothetical protein